MGSRGSDLVVLDERRRGARFLAHAARTVLNPPESTGIGCWSLNPYVGCEFGCSYCYARYAHRYVLERARNAGRITQEEFSSSLGPHGWEGFEHHIFVKERSAVLAALERDLPRVLARYARGQRDTLLIGTATDPYQPAERRFGITRAVLERLLGTPSLKLGLITKSPLVIRDTALLVKLASCHRVTVHISLISTSRRLVRLFEARSPMPHTRLRALEKLVDAGVHAGLLVAPVLPGITDSEASLGRLLSAAKQHGAQFAHPGPLRMYRAVQPVFLPLVEQYFPNLAPRYRAAYRRSEDAPREYALALKRRFARLANAAGVPVDHDLRDAPARRGGPQQLALWTNQPAEAT